MTEMKVHKNIRPLGCPTDAPPWVECGAASNKLRWTRRWSRITCKSCLKSKREKR